MQLAILMGVVLLAAYVPAEVPAGPERVPLDDHMTGVLATTAAVLGDRPERPAPALAPLVLHWLRDRGARPSADERSAIAALEFIDPDVRDAMAHVMVSFVALDRAASQHYTEAPEHVAVRLMDAARFGERAVGATAREIPAELVHLRDEVMASAARLTSAMAVAGDPGWPSVHMPPWLHIDLGPTDDVHVDDLVLSIDAGGNDAYRNNAGGSAIGGTSTLNGDLVVCSQPLDAPRVSLLIDAQGEDAYGWPELEARERRGCGVVGSGFLGVGVLVDGSGNDGYHAGFEAVIGSGDVGGMGALLDLAGNDRYDAEFLVTHGSAGLYGRGLLLDTSGNDVYAGGTLGVNGGGYTEGLAALVDLQGDDQYVAASGAPELGGAQNGGAVARGHGLLLDASGDDVYVGGDVAVNGGGFVSGSGRLVDMEGDDLYVATGVQGVNGGAGGLVPIVVGVGLLYDSDGRDTYRDPFIGECHDCSLVPKGELGAQVDTERP